MVFKSRRLLGLCAALIILFIPVITHAATISMRIWDNGTMTDLGALPGDSWSQAGGLNDNGQAVGQSGGSGDGVQNPYLWDNGTKVNLGTLGGNSGFAHAVNNAGQIVGTNGSTDPANPFPSHALLWENGAIQDLGNLGGNFAVATDINNNGQVAGVSWTASGVSNAFIWQNNVMTDLGLIGDQAAINNLGQVIVGSKLWDNGTVTELGFSAIGINDNGQIVGHSSSNAVLWENGVITDLGILGSTSFARAINNQGQITGDNGEHAFLWENGVVTDIEELRFGVDINENGQVLGHNSATAVIPIPSAVWLFGSGLIGLIGFARRKA